MCGYLRPTARRIVASLMSAAWSLFFNHWATSRQIDKFDRWSGGPAVPHNSIAACLASSRSGLRVGCGVVAWVATWRLSHSRKSSSTIANCEPLIGSTCSSLMMWSSPDLSASRTTTAAFSLLALRRWRTSVMASPNDSNEGVGSTALSFDAGDGQHLAYRVTHCSSTWREATRGGQVLKNRPPNSGGLSSPLEVRRVPCARRGS